MEWFLMLPVVKEIPYQDPVNIMVCFSDQEWLCFLDSAKESVDLGRYSFIVFNPFLKLDAGVSDPFLELQRLLSQYQFDTDKNLPPFQGGAVGYFSYDLLHYLENVPKHQLDILKLPKMRIGLYDTVISFDHKTKQAWVISHGISSKNFVACPVKANANCQYIIGKLSMVNSIDDKKKWSLKSRDVISSNFDIYSYHQMVQRVIDYIYDGDIFQANVSQCFSATLPEDINSMDLYLKLRKNNPAPFAAFLDYGDFSIASASPERFIKLEDNVVETRPIKGTRMRSVDPIMDLQLANELLNSQKDHAENTMITDLMRNDLSRVCEDHSVVVKKLCELESYATVHHLVSTVEGKLNPEFDAIDLLRATFPGGSITGAPKVRAMEIIAELEPTTRGPYCGSIGYIGFDGAMDTSIVIRTYLVKGNRVTFQAGGGIVADSAPADEYIETLTKVESLFNVLTLED
jgi:para-aminobenzoate synthetase component 1